MSKLCLGCMQQKACSPVCEHCGFDETAENLPHQLPIGTLLQNQYLVGKVLGQGGFGITYIGWDQHLSVPVAIKEYFPSGIVHRHTKLGTGVICETADTEKSFEKHADRFLKEARTLAKLADIPEIVQIRNFFSENGTAYIVMEYVQGITLKEHLKQLGRPMSETELLETIAPMLRALQKVHDQHLIHRDISPDNIMLPAGGGVKLIDFGTVRYVDNTGASKSTEAVLKPGFAPMEQYNTKGNLGTWTDVYALCASFHYLLTGKVPPDVHDRMDEGEELTLLRKNPELSSQLIQVLERGMRIRAAERIQTIDELYRLLYYGEELPAASQLVVESPAEGVSAASPTVTQNRIPASGKRFLIPGAAALAAVAAVGFLLLPQKRVPPPVPPILLPTAETTFPHFETQPSAEVSEIQYNYALSLIDAGMYDQAMETLAMLDGYKDSDLAYGYAQAGSYEKSGEYGKAAIAFAQVADFRDARARSYAAWRYIPGRKTVFLGSGGEWDSVLCAIREDGSTALDCDRSAALSEESIALDPVSGYRDLVSIHGVIGLRFDGTIVLPEEGQTSILLSADATARIQQLRPTLLQWTDIVAIAADPDYHIVLGLRSDGTVLVAGSRQEELHQVTKWQHIVLLAVSDSHVVGLQKGGTVVAAGDNRFRQCQVEDWSGIIDIAAFSGGTVGLLPNGNTVFLGNSAYNLMTFGNGWYNIAELVDGPFGILTTGMVRAGFTDPSSYRDSVNDWSSVVGVSTNAYDSVGLCADGTLVFTHARTPDFFARAQTWTDVQTP